MKKSLIYRPVLMAAIAVFAGAGFGLIPGLQEAPAAYAIITPPPLPPAPPPPFPPVEGEPRCCAIDPLNCDVDELDQCSALVECGNVTDACGSRPCCAGLTCNVSSNNCEDLSSSSSSSESSASYSSEESSSSSSEASSSSFSEESSSFSSLESSASSSSEEPSSSSSEESSSSSSEESSSSSSF